MLGRLFQKKMVDQDQFTSGPYVAVWIGQHTSEEQLDDYLFSGRFIEDFRFRDEDRRLPETCVEASERPLSDLVHGFSRFQKFQDEFLQKASALGITKASSMMVFYFMVYSPDGLPVSPKHEMTFIGNFWFEGFE